MMPQKMIAARIDVARIFAIEVAADRSEQLFFHDFGKAHDRVERRSKFMAHGREEARFGFVGGFGAPSRFVRNGARFFKLRDQAVLLGAIFDHGERRRMQAAREIDEEDVDADRHRGEREIERIAEREQPARDGERHRNRAGEENARQRRGKRHADRKHDHQRREDEDVRGERCRRGMRRRCAIEMPISAKAASAKPFTSSMRMKWRRHWPTLTSARGSTSRRRHWSSM